MIYTKATEGKYDAEASAALELVGAEAVLLVVKGGDKGDGFSIAVDAQRVSPHAILRDIPRVLRSVADSIEEQERERPIQ
jgi:hypothetical protein